MSNDDPVCSNCIGEEYLKLQIEASPSVTECAFCGTDAKRTLSVSEIAAFVSNMLEEHFQPTASEPDGLELMAVKYGDEDWYQDGTPLKELLEESVVVSASLAEAIADELIDDWFDWSTHEHTHGDNPHFEEARADTSDLGSAWFAFENRLLRESRLLDAGGLAMLESIFGPAVDDQSRNGSVITELTPGEDNAKFFRARFFVDDQGLHEALRDPEAQLGPPPSELALAGRLNAHGISVFYGAFSTEVAVCEIRPPVGSNLLVGEFHPVVPMRLLDLSKLREVIVSSSLFDPATKNRYARTAFLKELIERITSPVLPHRTAHEYLVTQIIADYLANHPSLRLHGIIYPSTQAGKTDSHNVMLFHAHAYVEQNAPIEDVTLYERDDDGWDFSPSIREGSSQDEQSLTHSEADTRAPALRLDRSSLRILKVGAVKFTTDEKPVYVSRSR